MFDIKRFYPTIPISEQVAITERQLHECLLSIEAESDVGIKALLLGKAVDISIDLDVDRIWADLEQQYKKNQ